MAKGKPKRKPFGMNSSLADATQVMRQLPVSAMLSSIEMQINILQERGVEIRDWENKDRVLKQDRKSTRLNSSHIEESRMPSSA